MNNTSISAKEQIPVEKAIYREVFEPDVQDIWPVTAIKWDTLGTVSVNSLDLENIKNQREMILRNNDRSTTFVELIKENKLSDDRIRMLREEFNACHERDMATARLGQEAASHAREAQKEKTNLIGLVIALASIPTIAGALLGIMAAFSSGNKDNN